MTVRRIVMLFSFLCPCLLLATNPSFEGTLFLAVGDAQGHVVSKAEAALGHAEVYQPREVGDLVEVRAYSMNRSDTLLLYFYNKKFMQAAVVKSLKKIPSLRADFETVTLGVGPVLGYIIKLQGKTIEVNSIDTGPDGVKEFPKGLAGDSDFRKAIFAGESPVQIQFTPSTNRAYSPVPEHKVTCYKMINHFEGQPERVFKDTEPPKHYEVIGTLELSETWYYDPDIQQLLDMYVSQHGGDDVLKFENFQKRGQVLLDPRLGRPGHYYFQSIKVSILKYTE
jgi:hypothetical protein